MFVNVTWNGCCLQYGVRLVSLYMRKRGSSLTRGLCLLEAIIADGAESTLSKIARDIGLPVATAHRYVVRLVETGWLMPTRYGRHTAGPVLHCVIKEAAKVEALKAMATPILEVLAKRVRSVVHLGTLDHDMVTYGIKTGQGADALFTREGMQLEAYCSGIGKVLLAELPDDALDHYLAAAPFVALTPNTITDPATLRSELHAIRSAGFAEDREEIALGLRCLAFPVRDARGNAIAAISISRSAAAAKANEDLAPHVALLKDAANAIERRMLPFDRDELA